MIWNLKYHPEAVNDFNELDGSQKLLVRKAIKKVLQNPLPSTEGGYGKPLGNKNGKDLTGLLKIKLRSSGIRIIYKLIRKKDEVFIIVIGMRQDDEVYETAAGREQ